jgi:hypothetical protein
MPDKPKVDADSEKGGFSPSLEKPRKEHVGPTPTDDPDRQVETT